MIPAGYMAKRVQKPKGFHMDGIADVYSVSGHINEDFKVSTWLRFMRRMPLSALLFLATVWQKKFGRINTACLNRLPMHTIDLAAARSTPLNRARTASSRFIQ
jgi:hypothetical protein